METKSHSGGGMLALLVLVVVVVAAGVVAYLHFGRRYVFVAGSANSAVPCLYRCDPATGEAWVAAGVKEWRKIE